MKINIFFKTLVCIALTGVLAACNGGGGGSPAPTPTGGPTPTPTPTAPPSSSPTITVSGITQSFTGSSDAPIMQGQSGTFTATIGSRTNDDVTTLSPSDNSGQYTIEPSTCNLSDANPSCTFTLTSIWNPFSTPNTILLAHSGAPATLASNQISVNSEAPAIYLPMTGSLEESEPAGIPWSGARFTAVNTDCVSDALTGLEWHNTISDLNQAESGAVTWNNAFAKVTAADNATLCGHNDWRLPNINELGSLINYGANNQRDWLSNNNFDIPQSLAGSNLWSSTVNAESTTQALSVNLGSGQIMTKNMTESMTNRVLLVRGNSGS
jgi:hypothetical protein